MQIDVTKLLLNQIRFISIDSEVNISNYLIKKSLIDELKKVKISGKIVLNEEREIYLTAKITGIMKLKDDLTLEPVEYNFTTDIEEILDDRKNIIDITDIIWQNIITEIPSKVRNTDEDVEIVGDGWRVISEDKFFEERKHLNNPFSEIDELLKIKEEK